MSSKQVTSLEKLGSRVAAATADEARNDRAMQGLIERCADVVPEGTTSLTVAEAQATIGRQITFEREELRLSDDDHLLNVIGERGQRQVRDDSVTEVYGVLLRTRSAFDTIHGPGSAAGALGLNTRVPDDPVQLFQTGDRCRRLLRNPRSPLPEVRLPGFRFDPEEMASGIDGPVDRLGQVLADLPEDLKHSVDSLAVKLRRMKRLDQLIGRGARLMEALYDIAGMEEESDRVRQSSHRAGGGEAAESAEPSAEPLPDGASEAPASEAGAEAAPPDETASDEPAPQAAESGTEAA